MSNIQKEVSVKKRIRSASTDRDKRSEFHARYWAFLFGNLQRAVDEIYKTVEYYENLESCQEAILVLENYIREFKALANFFRMSWDYEKTPKRPQSVAWEVRKTNALPRMRSRNSPAISGKSSPSYSGTSSPCGCPTIEEHKRTTPNRKSVVKENHLVVEQIALQSDSLSAKEKKFEELVVYLKESCDDEDINQGMLQKPKSLSLENLNQEHGFRILIMKIEASSQTEGLLDDHLTLQEFNEKYSVPKILQLEDDNLQVEQPPAPENTATTTENLNQTFNAANSTFTLDNSSAVEDEKSQVIVEETKKEKSEATKAATQVEKIKSNKDENNECTKSNNIPAPTITPLSQILKPSENEKEIKLPNTNVSKSQPKAPIRANYSLRNQTITSKNPRMPEKMTRKPNISTQVTNRTSRVASNNIPPKNSVLNTQKNFIPGRSKTMIEISKNQPPVNAKVGELRKKKSTEDNTDSSSSTLKASIERLGSKSSLTKSNTNNEKSSYNNNGKKKSSDGEWFTVTVKNKRRSSWANRFSQPSASASLPTLAALLNENSEESDKEQGGSAKDKPLKNRTNKTEADGKTVAKPKLQDQNNKREIKVKSKVTLPPKQQSLQNKTKPVISSAQSNKKLVSNVKAKVNSNPPKKQVTVVEKANKQPLANKQHNQQNQQLLNTIKRQKSDLTGLKIKSLHKEYLRNERSSSGKKKKDNSNDSKVDMNVQTVLISQTIDELYTEIGNMKNMTNFSNGTLSSCEEIEERDLESDDDQKKLVEEQENLERQIRELENSEFDIDTDETDCEAILCDLDDNESSENNDLDSLKDTTFADENMSLEMRYAPMLTEMSVQERKETLVILQELVARDPGRAQKLHQKLSSPSRRRSVRETLKKYQVKHTRALEKRITIQQHKAQKIQQLIQRVEQVKAAREQLIENRRLKMEEKLQRATENRENYLKNKIKKAHDEEEKLKEIAFIKNLEMQNKMLDFIESCKEQEVRRQDLEQER